MKLQVAVYLGLRAVPDPEVPVEPIRGLFLDAPTIERAQDMVMLIKTVVWHLVTVGLLSETPDVRVEVYDEAHKQWNPLVVPK